MGDTTKAFGVAVLISAVVGVVITTLFIGISSVAGIGSLSNLGLENAVLVNSAATLSALGGILFGLWAGAANTQNAAQMPVQHLAPETDDTDDAYR